jgi:hypothetical protein
MASQENEKAMDGLLRRSLARDGAAKGECLNPEALAAYYDQSLGATEAANYDLHFSQCPRCREQLAMMARAGAGSFTNAQSDPVPVAARAADRVAGATPRSAAVSAESKVALASQSRPRRLLDLRWLVPVAAVLVLSTLVFIRFASRGNQAALDSQVAMSTPTPTLQDQNEASAANSEADKKSSETAKASAAKEKPRSPSSAKLSEIPPTSGPAHTVSPGAASRPSRPGAISRPSMRAGLAGSARVHSSASESVVEEPAPSAPPPELNAALPSIPVATDAATPAPPPAPSAQSSGRSTHAINGLGLAGRSARGAVSRSAPAATKSPGGRLAAPVITTPDSNVLYRIQIGGFIERSQDGGVTWQGQLLDSSAELRAASAPTPDVCWVVGRAGVVFITDDGKNWGNVSIPAGSDLTSVDAKDALSATVSANDGQKWSTEDGGKTWTSAK